MIVLSIKVPVVFMEDILDATCEAGMKVDGTPTKPRFKLIKAEPSDITETAAHTLQWVASNQSKQSMSDSKLPSMGLISLTIFNPMGSMSTEWPDELHLQMQGWAESLLLVPFR